MNTDIESKKALLSGKLNGTRSLISDLSGIENPDDIEQFLLAFNLAKFEAIDDNEIIYIADDQEFQTPANKTGWNYIRLNSISTALISTFIAKEQPVKYAFNSFSFIKWCISKNIDIRNIYDIPTYIKLLTNEIDPFKSINDYIKEYTNYTYYHLLYYINLLK